MRVVEPPKQLIHILPQRPQLPPPLSAHTHITTPFFSHASATSSSTSSAYTHTSASSSSISISGGGTLPHPPHPPTIALDASLEKYEEGMGDVLAIPVPHPLPHRPHPPPHAPHACQKYEGGVGDVFAIPGINVLLYVFIYLYIYRYIFTYIFT